MSNVWSAILKDASRPIVKSYVLYCSHVSIVKYQTGAKGTDLIMPSFVNTTNEAPSTPRGCHTARTILDPSLTWTFSPTMWNLAQVSTQCITALWSKLTQEPSA